MKNSVLKFREALEINDVKNYLNLSKKKLIFIGFTYMDISLHVHASVLDYSNTCIMIVVFLCAVSVCRISRQKLTQTRLHTSR